MFGGEKTRVKLQFANSLLDTVIDRFGTKDPFYAKVDDEHFSINCEVEISPQFYGWLSGFGTKVKIMNPDSVRNEYVEYMRSILGQYEY